MKLIFNHLLLRILDLATERLVFLAQQKDNIHKWVKSDPDEKVKHVKRAELAIDGLLRNKNCIQGVLQALEETKPAKLTVEQDMMVSNVRRVFRWGLGEYKAVLEYAREVGFDTQVIEGLREDQRLVARPQQEQIQGEEEE